MFQIKEQGKTSEEKLKKGERQFTQWTVEGNDRKDVQRTQEKLHEQREKLKVLTKTKKI